jgi:hypothetical protein
MFASLSVRSIFCSKAMPIVRQIMYVFSFSSSHHFPIRTVLTHSTAT